MNRIIKPFLDNHIKSYDLTCKESEAFEHFFNYLIIRNYTSRHFDPGEISLGKGEVGIDGIAIIVNDTLITTSPQIEELFKVETDITVSFVFIQSKTSENFDSSGLNQFFSSVNDFIREGRITMNDKATELRRVCQYILNNPTKLSKNPDCHLFFSFTGKSQKDPTRDALVELQKNNLRQTSLFDEVTFSLYDAPKIIASCRAINGNINKTINMVDCAVIPPVHDVEEAYIGITKCKDFINLITNEDGAIISNLFEDNVRYFQGHNTINAEIQTTLRKPEKQEEFSVLNNGVTIVAKKMRRTGNKITMSGFQVINGCQTSFVLYENRSKLTENSYIIVKIICTEDKDITDSIVKTTNRQTPVLNEAFETLRDFHKNLELAYGAYDAGYRLYYERRSKQYDSEEINKNRIISFPFQTTSYVAVFLGEPHSTHRYYGELLKSYSKRLYNDNDVLEQYCMASMYVYITDNFFKHNGEYNIYKKFRFHIAFILRNFADQRRIPEPSSREMKKYCDNLYSKISDENWVIENIKRACELIQEIIDEGQFNINERNDITRKREFTNQILEKIGSISVVPQLPRLEKGVKVRCRVNYWNNSFVYVDLIGYKERGSIYIRNITGNYIKSIDEVLKDNQEFDATILEDKPHPVFGYELTMLS